ncbi:hypothetical protein [Caminibacter mediatlanticus]|uniref:Uncharacterized protein n=1 Tax=Caminibacter mediatlanticus TB-2 TaxID=391592 RepID=A0AAI9AHJ7_9BACT|nr:hypothetical protein [Caminibacter mediatlanticus]EDM23640.1 hypothetical protein CMTB2_05127 [Caminibacter mediatlanticus TB-2]
MKLSKIASFILAGTIAIFSVGCGTNNDATTSTTNTTTSTPNTTTVSGTVIDGPIYNAKVCVDYNFNSKCDDDEPSAITDINGSYSLNNVDLTQNAPLIVIPQSDTIDVSTAKSFNKILSAPLDGSIVNINPLTTIVGAKIYDLYKEGNLSKESINLIESEVAEALEVNDLTSINILENPTLYAKAVVISQILPDSNSSIEDLNDKIDFTKIKDGNFTGAIKDTIIQDILSNLNNIDINDSIVIQQAIESAIENNETNISNIAEIGLKEILTKNVFYKQESGGLPIIFDENNSYFNIHKDDENETGSWRIEGDKIILDSIDGAETNITLKSVNAYIYEVEGKKLDTNGTIETFEDKVLAIPKDINGSNIDKLPGITPLTDSDIAGKTFIEEDGTYSVFDSDGTYEEIDTNGTVKYTTTWKINNGVLEFEGKDEDDSWLVKTVRFGDYLFALIVKDNEITKGYILPIEELKTNVELPNTPTSAISSVDEFLNALDFTPVNITQDQISGKKLIFDDVTLYFTSDGSFYAVGKGTYEIDKNVIILKKDDNITVTGYLAFSSFSSDNGDYTYYDVKENKFYNGNVKIASFDENSFNPYPSYVINNKTVNLDVDDDVLNLDEDGKVQFKIVDGNETGIQCTTNFTSFDDFINAFNNGELILDSKNGEISCLYMNNGNSYIPTSQTEQIKFIDNNDTTCEVHLISGYFSGDDYNITAIDDDLLTIEK